VPMAAEDHFEADLTGPARAAHKASLQTAKAGGGWEPLFKPVRVMFDGSAAASAAQANSRLEYVDCGYRQAVILFHSRMVAE
jgi:hypothetical protein